MNSIFTKHNPRPGTNTLLCEARGLEELAVACKGSSVSTPNIITVSQDALQLQRISSSSPNAQAWKNLAKGLAHIHKTHNDQFGWDEDNFIGLNPQKNGFNSNWGEFFLNQRLGYQVQLIAESELKSQLSNLLDKHHTKLVEFLNAQAPKPSLVHGDLWSGNVMFEGEQPYLIDPAAYYGDREVDLAMAKMFGGFDALFFQTYDKEYPLPNGFDVRTTIYNPYHYLNHYNLFGGSYLSEVMAGLRVMEEL